MIKWLLFLYALVLFMVFVIVSKDADIKTTYQNNVYHGFSVFVGIIICLPICDSVICIWYVIPRDPDDGYGKNWIQYIWMVIFHCNNDSKDLCYAGACICFGDHWASNNGSYWYSNLFIPELFHSTLFQSDGKVILYNK